MADDEEVIGIRISSEEALGRKGLFRDARRDGIRG